MKYRVSIELQNIPTSWYSLKVSDIYCKVFYSNISSNELVYFGTTERIPLSKMHNIYFNKISQKNTLANFATAPVLHISESLTSYEVRVDIYCDGKRLGKSKVKEPEINPTGSAVSVVFPGHSLLYFRERPIYHVVKKKTKFICAMSIHPLRPIPIGDQYFMSSDVLVPSKLILDVDCPQNNSTKLHNRLRLKISVPRSDGSFRTIYWSDYARFRKRGKVKRSVIPLRIKVWQQTSLVPQFHVRKVCAFQRIELKRNNDSTCNYLDNFELHPELGLEFWRYDPIRKADVFLARAQLDCMSLIQSAYQQETVTIRLLREDNGRNLGITTGITTNLDVMGTMILAELGISSNHKVVYCKFQTDLYISSPTCFPTLHLPSLHLSLHL